MSPSIRSSKSVNHRNIRPRARVRAALLLLAIASFAPVSMLVGGSAAQASPTTITTTGLTPGSIQHVWIIILENKSYDETFTGLNSNSYLWQTLPSEGVLLKSYYGTGHSSMDNYISVVSGQGPIEDTQQDCSDTNVQVGSNATIVTTGTVGADTPNWNYGQILSALGANHAIGSGTTTTNGCTYPSEIPTLFDQFNLAGVSWKGYAQDLGGQQPLGANAYVADSVPNRDDGVCGAPGSSSENVISNPTYLTAATGHPLPSDVSSFTAASLVSGTGNSPYDGLAYSNNNPEYMDTYVGKHFPFPWFESLVGSYGQGANPASGLANGALTEPAAAAGGGTNCDPNHIANLDSPTNGLIHDLQANTVPEFNWITPNNCSDAHDTSCKGNNLSGAFGLYNSSNDGGNSSLDGQVDLNDPLYTQQQIQAAYPSGTPNNTVNISVATVDAIPSYDPEAIPPRNYTGGLYASDMFLAYYVPLIESSPAYAHGLIDVTFDEGEPSFTYSGNSFNNVLTTSSTDGGTHFIGTTCTQAHGCSNPDAPTFGTVGSTAPGADSVYGAYGILADAAGENIGGTNVFDEPTGPNTTLSTDGSGNQVDPGPGNNAFIDRPPVCTSQSPLTPSNCVPNIFRGGSGTSPGTRTDSVTGTASSSSVADGSIIGDDTGRAVNSITIGGTAISGSALATDFLSGLFVGAVTDAGPLYPVTSGGATVSGSFQLVDDAGNPVDTATDTSEPGGAITSVTLSAEGDPNDLPSGDTVDPLFDATDPTPGGGVTGSVLISPYITPGSVSTTNYNHYSWLRTMEDIFDVSSCVGTGDVTLPTGTVCGGLDGLGHIGYAAQQGLEPFGTDVFTSPQGDGFQELSPPIATPEAPLAIAIPALGLLLMLGFVRTSRRRKAAVSIG